MIITIQPLTVDQLPEPARLAFDAGEFHKDNIALVLIPTDSRGGEATFINYQEKAEAEAAIHSMIFQSEIDRHYTIVWKGALDEID